MKKVFLFVIASFLLISKIRPQNYGFSAAPDFYQDAMGRDDASVFVIGDKAYVGLGTRSDYSLGNDFYFFDAITNTWSQAANFPLEGRQYSTAFTLNGKAYIVGGAGSNNIRYKDVWQYDPSGNSWAQLADFPGTKCQGMQAAVYNSNAYLFFGKDSAAFLGAVWKFNGNDWIQLTNFPDIPRYLGTYVQLGDNVYFVSGYDGSILRPEVWMFNLQNENWTQLADFPGTTRWYGRGFHFENKIYVGTGWASNFLNDFWEYDPSAQLWQPAPALPSEARKGMAAFNIGNRAFIGMGANQNGGRDKQFWEFVANADIHESKLNPVKIYPNPATDFIQVSMSKTFEKCSYKIIDVSGKCLAQENIVMQNFGIQTSGLSTGFYCLLISMDEVIYRERFYIQRN